MPCAQLNWFRALFLISNNETMVFPQHAPMQTAQTLVPAMFCCVPSNLALSEKLCHPPSPHSNCAKHQVHTCHRWHSIRSGSDAKSLKRSMLTSRSKRLPSPAGKSFTFEQIYCRPTHVIAEELPTVKKLKRWVIVTPGSSRSHCHDLTKNDMNLSS